MKFKTIENKELYFNENYPLKGAIRRYKGKVEKLPIPKMTDKMHCLHCRKDIVVGDYKVELFDCTITKKVQEYIVCPNAPKCDGWAIDWCMCTDEI